MKTPCKALPVATAVQFTAEWLSRLSPDEARRFKDRVGKIGGYRGQVCTDAPLPIVDFEKVGRLKAERLFEVPWARLEVVDSQVSKD